MIRYENRIKSHSKRVNEKREKNERENEKKKIKIKQIESF
jgi:hypothetical protein